MNYAYVKDGTVVKTGKLPTSFGNISGFDKADAQTLKNNGWYPLETTQQPVLALDESYGNKEYVIEQDKVTVTTPVVKKTLDELKTLLKQKARSFVMSKFETEYPYSQGLAIALNIFGTTARDNMTTRLNELILGYKTFSDEVDLCTTKAELLVVYNNYPQLKGE